MTKERVVILIILVIIVGIMACVVMKPSIHDADLHDLQAIDDIGPILAQRVIDYVDEHPNCDIEDILDVQGIGRKRLFKLKLRYGD